MSSTLRKVQTRIELKQENSWLRNAFKRAFQAAEEQSRNAAELSQALWAAAQQNGGALRIAKATLTAMPHAAQLRTHLDADTNQIIIEAIVGPAADALPLAGPDSVAGSLADIAPDADAPLVIGAGDVSVS